MKSRTVQSRRGQSQQSQRKKMGNQSMSRGAGYRSYQQEMERRNRVVRTPRPDAAVTAYRRPSGYNGSISASVQRRRSKKKQNVKYFDYDLLLVIVFLMCFGLVMLYSTSAYSAQADFQDDMYYFSKQAIIGAAGFFVMLFVSKVDYHFYGAFAKESFIFAFILMALVQTPLGKEVNGARRWINLPGGLTLQPAEVTKIAMILFISYELCRLGRRAYSKEGIIWTIFFGAVGAGGVFVLTENLSTAIIVMGITCILIFVVHPKTKPFIKFVGACAAFVVAGIILLLATGVTHSDNFRLRRIISWLDPSGTADDGSYQLMQGLYAIGSGGFFGKGLGNSTQKLTAIPEAQNDMILTVICEELGVLGVIVILCLFGFMLYRLMFIARNAPDLFGSLIATGIFGHIALQVILNVAVVTGIFPTTGITLPFISYGGTAVVFLLAEMGIALGISSKIELKEQ